VTIDTSRAPELYPTLTSADYCAAEIFDLERRTIFHRGWMYVCHIDGLPAGTKRVFDIAGESVLLTRDPGGTLHAFANVCRHRGAQLCDPALAEAAAGSIRCHYHSWTYALDGRLVATPRVDDEFDRGAMGLWTHHAEVCNGMVFVSLAARPQPFDDWLAATTPGLAAFEQLPIAEYRIGARTETVVQANWKIIVENYSECLHCAVVHPELAELIPLYRTGNVVHPDDPTAPVAFAEGRVAFTRTGQTAQSVLPGVDPRATALVENFAGQWLFLRNVPITGPTPSDFPDFDDTLRQAFRRETELFFESVLREDRSAVDLLRGDYTFLNERLALHYGIHTVKGSHFRRYTWGEGSVRRGLLGQGSILTLTSYPDRTSPVVRGKWVLENLLGTPPPPPLPDVGPLKPTNGTGTVLSMRERLARHRASPVCSGCHSMLDPLGLALESYDAVGKWRTRDESAQPIDLVTVLPDGTKVTGPDGLRQALLARSDRFLATLTGKLLTYALGRRLEYYDAPAIRAILRQAEPGDFRLGTGIIMGIVQSPAFQMRRAQS